jgi:hypothetical protein
MAEAINVGSIIASMQADPTEMVKGVAQCREALQALAKEMAIVEASFQAGTMEIGPYTDRMHSLLQAEGLLERQLKATYTALGATSNGLELVTMKSDQWNAANRRLGSSLLQVSYIVDDFQYSVMACVNNIGPLVFTMTGSGGWAAAAQVTAVATSQLVNHWDQLLASMAGTGLSTQASEMARLGKETHKTADETERLKKLQKLHAEEEKMANARPELEQKSEKAIAKTIQEADYDKVLKGVAEALQVTGQAPKLTEDEKWWVKAGVQFQDAMDTLNPLKGTTSAAKPVQGLGTLYREAIGGLEQTQLLDKAKKLMAESATDPKAMNQLVALFKSAPGTAPPGFVDALKRGSPESIANQEAADRKLRRDAEMAKIREAMGKKAGVKAAAAKRFDAAWLRTANAKETKAHKTIGTAMKGAAHWVASGVKIVRAATARREVQRKAAVKRSKSLIPGLARGAERLTLQAMASGDPDTAMGQIKDQIKAALKAKGLNARDADDAARDAAEVGRIAAGKRVDRAKDKGGGKEEDGPNKNTAKSEVYSLASHTAKIQSGVGDEAKQERHKQTDLLTEIAKTLARSEGKNTVRVEVK